MLTSSAVVSCLILQSGAYVGPKLYRIQNGDTFSHIAHQNNLGYERLANYNAGLDPERLKIGTVIKIPARLERPLDTIIYFEAKPVAKAAEPKNTNYIVKNGDNDWTIAPRYGIAPSELRELNPDIDWRRLQIGQEVRVPGGAPVSTPVRSSQPLTTTKGSYTVVSGDNDWVIASQLGIKPSELRALNPEINWRRLQIGDVLDVPGGSTSSSSSTSVIRSKRVTITASRVNVRSSATTSAAKVSVASKGQVASVLDRSGDWYKLKFSNGLKGWIRGDLLRSASSADVARANRAGSPSKVTTPAAVAANAKVATDSLVATAKSLLGVPYRWGGNDVPAKYRNSVLTSRGSGRYNSRRPNGGLDCSGFTCVVYSVHGIKLPRTSAAQSKFGSYVPRAQLAAGDLVFFRTRRGTRVSHVGIYIGNNKFIHASSAGNDVEIDSITGYYDRRYVTARRPGGVKAGSAVVETAAKKASPTKSAEEKAAEAKIEQSASEDKAAMEEAAKQLAAGSGS